MTPWFSFVSMGTVWQVVRGDEYDSGLEAGDEGVTIPERSTIIIRITLTHSRACVVVVHEILHAVVSTPGENVLLARILGCSEDDATSREEEIVTLWGPKFADTIMRNGLIQLPTF